MKRVTLWSGAAVAVLLLAMLGQLPAYAQGFSAPVKVSTGNPDTRDPQVAVDQTGVNFTWRTENWGQFFFRRTTDGGSSFTSDPVPLLLYSSNLFEVRACTVFGTCPRYEHLASDSQGNIYVVASDYQESDTAWGTIFRRSTDHGQTFSPGVWLTQDDVADPEILVDGAGNINVVWTGSDDEVYFTRSTDHGMSFSSPMLLSPGTTNTAHDQHSVMDSNGNINVVWTDGRSDISGKPSRVHFRHVENSVDGPVAYPTVVLGALAPLAQFDARVAVDERGVIHLVWSTAPCVGCEMTSKPYSIQYAYSVDDGLVFSDSVRVAGSDLSQFSPQTMVDRYGQIGVAWVSGEGLLLFSRSKDGGTNFTAPLRLAAVPIYTEKQAGFNPRFQLLNDAAGNIDVLWSEMNAYQWSVKFARSTDGGVTFCLPQVLAGGAGKEWPDPKMTSDQQGNLNVVWLQLDPSSLLTEVFYARLTLGSTPTGEDITVQPVDPVTGTSPVTITFGDVTEAGETTVVTSSEGPAPPKAFKLGSPPVYYQISTTAQVTPPITICIHYSEEFKNEASLKLSHWTGSGWELLANQTLDTANDIICGEASSFSTFAVMEPAYVFSGFLPPIRSDGNAVFKSGRTIPIKFQLWDTNGTLVTDAHANLLAYKLTDDVLGSVEVEASGESNPDSTFRFDASSNQYVFNLSTRGYQGTYLLRVQLDDGSTHEVYVSVR